MKPYLIAYFYNTNEGNWGFGNIPIEECDGKFNLSDIRDIEKQIREKNSLKGVAIINILPLEKENCENDES